LQNLTFKKKSCERLAENGQIEHAYDLAKHILEDADFLQHHPFFMANQKEQLVILEKLCELYCSSLLAKKDKKDLPPDTLALWLSLGVPQTKVNVKKNDLFFLISPDQQKKPKRNFKNNSIHLRKYNRRSQEKNRPHKTKNLNMQTK
jgi:hypothetical protein